MADQVSVTQSILISVGSGVVGSFIGGFSSLIVAHFNSKNAKDLADLNVKAAHDAEYSRRRRDVLENVGKSFLASSEEILERAHIARVLRHDSSDIKPDILKTMTERIKSFPHFFSYDEKLASSQGEALLYGFDAIAAQIVQFRIKARELNGIIDTAGNDEMLRRSRECNALQEEIVTLVAEAIRTG